jgi:3,5-epimerase/4-reductase
MILLVYGGNGWIGSQFIEYLLQLKWPDLYIVRGQARVDNVDQVLDEMRECDATHVMSFIGRTHGGGIKTIDYLEQPGKLVENVRDNLFGPLILARLCEERGIHFTYLGTGCIFEYDHDKHVVGDGEGWTEEDLPNFFGSSYSIVKGYTDQLMHLFPDSVLNLRIRMPITNVASPRNFITKITGYERICSIPNSMTVLPDFFPVWWDMICKRKTGTYNCTNPGVIEHNEILGMYRELVDPAFEWKNFTIEEQDAILASKRSNNRLDTSRLEREYPQVLGIRDSVRRVLLAYNTEI